jgi:hypothetical protein
MLVPAMYVAGFYPIRRKSVIGFPGSTVAGFPRIWKPGQLLVSDEDSRLAARRAGHCPGLSPSLKIRGASASGYVKYPRRGRYRFFLIKAIQSKAYSMISPLVGHWKHCAIMFPDRAIFCGKDHKLYELSGADKKFAMFTGPAF